MTIPSGWHAKAHELWLSEKSNDAIQTLLKSINSTPGQESPKLLIQFAYYLFLLGDYKAAIPVFDRIIQLTPEDLQSKLNMAVCHSRARNTHRAIEIYNELALKIPHDFKVWTGLADCQSRLGNNSEASFAGTKCLNIKDSQSRLIDHKWVLPHSGAKEHAFGKKKVIAFSLFGKNPRYLRGALHNVLVAAEIYPDWICRFYIDGTIPAEFIRTVKSYGSELITCANNQPLANKLAWRFNVANDPTVGYFMVRDADSVVNTRERVAVAEWLSSDCYFHVMRDWWTHTELIMAGMWGGVAGVLPSIEGLSKSYISTLMDTPNSDQIFLRDIVWPYVRQSVCIHDRYFDVPGAKKLSEPIPVEGFHIGQDEFSVRRQEQAVFLIERLGKLDYLSFDNARK